MRYRVGEEVTAAQVVTGTDDMLLLTCAIGIFIGVVLTYAAWRGRQWWLVFWAGGLIPVSIATMFWEILRTQT
ncbi:MAG: hypothetical protein ACPGQI_08460 [Gammaproteobacteria bacterium]